MILSQCLPVSQWCSLTVGSQALSVDLPPVGSVEHNKQSSHYIYCRSVKSTYNLNNHVMSYEHNVFYMKSSVVCWMSVAIFKCHVLPCSVLCFREWLMHHPYISNLSLLVVNFDSFYVFTTCVIMVAVSLYMKGPKQI